LSLFFHIIYHFVLPVRWSTFIGGEVWCVYPAAVPSASDCVVNRVVNYKQHKMCHKMSMQGHNPVSIRARARTRTRTPRARTHTHTHTHKPGEQDQGKRYRWCVCLTPASLLLSSIPLPTHVHTHSPSRQCFPA
jgi:hypothetical protein